MTTFRKGVFKLSYIDDIYMMDEIFSIEQKVSKKYGIPIYNVSHWDSSKDFQAEMNRVLKMPCQSLPWDYYYTYSLSKEDRNQVLENLGLPCNTLSKNMGLLLQSSTISIVNIINLLKHYKKKKLCILEPAYFSVAHCCNMFSLDYSTEYITFRNGRAYIPLDKILVGGYDCIWITSPIFCTGIYYNDDEISKIKLLQQKDITIILDESLSLPGKELVRALPITQKTFAIYSPHKAISMNGVKFSVIVCNKCYEDFLEQWVDVFSGALAGSNRDAIFHYISSNYVNDCYNTYINYINKSRMIIKNVIDKYPVAQTMTDAYGHYMNIFIDKVIKKSEILPLLEELISACQASFIPGCLNGFDPDAEFCFRVNLTQKTKQLEFDTDKILSFFNDYYH